MTHNTEKADTRVVRDEMEKKSRERSWSWHSRETGSAQRCLLYYAESQSNCWGQKKNRIFTRHLRDLRRGVT